MSRVRPLLGRVSYQFVSLTYTYRIHPERRYSSLGRSQTVQAYVRTFDSRYPRENRGSWSRKQGHTIHSSLSREREGPDNRPSPNSHRRAHTQPLNFPNPFKSHTVDRRCGQGRVSPTSLSLSDTRPHTHHTRVMWRRCGMIRCDCGAIR